MYDEILLDLKVFQKNGDDEEKIFSQVTAAEHLMNDEAVVTPVVKRIL